MGEWDEALYKTCNVVRVPFKSLHWDLNLFVKLFFIFKVK